MLEIHFHPFPLIATERLLLRRLHQNDVPEMFFLRSDESMMQYLDKPKLKTPGEAGELIGRMLQLESENQGINWGITMKGNDTLIGTIALFHFQKEHYRCELGYMLHNSLQGKGLMQEAISAVLEYGFRTLKLHSIEANVNPENVASIKVLERNTFVREAYYRENYFYDGKFLDTAVYSLISPY